MTVSNNNTNNNNSSIIYDVVTGFINMAVISRGLEIKISPSRSTDNYVQTKNRIATMALAFRGLIGYMTARIQPIANNKKIEKKAPVTLESNDTRELNQWGVRKDYAAESHIRSIDQLTTRKQVVDWLITYQHLTAGGNGKNVISGTAGAGLSVVLRGAMIGEKLNVLDDSAAAAIVDTLKELREKGELSILNSPGRASSLRLQEIETKQHRLRAANYDAFGKVMSNLSPEFRANLAWVASEVPGLAKPSVGLL